MRVYLFDLDSWEQDRVRQRLSAAPSSLAVECLSERLSLANAERFADAEGIGIFVYTTVDHALLARLPHLRLVLTMSTGYDHIDLAACAARGITVCSVPHYGENTVAEHTFALILALSRKVHRAYRRVQQGDFTLDGLRGFDLAGKTLGVIGAGNIGLHVIRIARGFGMRVLAYDIRPQPLLAEVLGFSYVPLPELLAQADIISLHVPATPETYHLIDREKLALVKRGALLINTARGSVVDTEALLWALEEGILGGAGLDVIEGEQAIAEERALLYEPVTAATLRQIAFFHLLLRRDDVIFTPHIAFNSWEALGRIIDTTVENLLAFLAGHPQNVVPPP